MSRERDSRASKTYLPPLYQRLVKGEALIKNESVSAIIGAAVKNRYDSLPQVEREKILRKAK